MSPRFDFFDTWSSDMAYVLGLVVTDGCIDRRGYYVSIKLKTKDSLVLDKIKELLRLNNKIYEEPPSEKLRLTGKLAGKIIRCHGVRMLRINSKHIVSRLAELGVHPKKSLREVFPPVPKEYLRDFLRGYFDGDGNVYEGHQKIANCASLLDVRLLGNFALLSQVKSVLSVVLKLRSGSISQGEACSDGSFMHSLSYKKIPAKKFMNWIYSSLSTLFLERKKEYYRRFMELEKDEELRLLSLRQARSRHAALAKSKLKLAMRCE